LPHKVRHALRRVYFKRGAVLVHGLHYRLKPLCRSARKNSLQLLRLLLIS
jgi:hypothetical protein